MAAQFFSDIEGWFDDIYEDEISDEGVSLKIEHDDLTCGT